MTEIWHLVDSADAVGGYGTNYGAAYGTGSEDIAEVADGDLEAVTARDAINPFATEARLTLDDPDGEKPGAYPRPTLVELWVEIPGVMAPRRQFGGFVIDHALDRNETELHVLGHDFWLRKPQVFANYDGARLSTVLEDLITTLTPLVWDPDLVDVEDDIEITATWSGEQLVRVLDEIRELAGGDELYGATPDREFLFRPLTEDDAPRAFEPAEYLDADFAVDGKPDANQSIVRYGDDDERVVIHNDGPGQLALGEAIGADAGQALPVQERRPEIDSEDRGLDRTGQLIEERSEVETGQIDTWEGFDLDPGQITRVDVPEEGIDDEYRIVELEYEWPAGNPPTTVTVADKAIDTVDELVDLSDDVQRLDLRDTDPDAPVTQVIGVEAGVVIHVDGDVDGVAIERARVTNRARNKIRDAWAGRGDPLEIVDLAVGDDPSGLSQTNTDLRNETDRASATETLVGDDVVEYDATVGETDIRELGLFDADGDLVVRAIVEGDVDGTPTATLSLTAENDPTATKAVVTETGQEATRDVIADNDPDLPTQYGWGSDATDPQETDTGLLDPVITTDLDELLIQAASTGGEWEAIL